MAIEVGSKIEGKVTGITNFGVFVDLGENKTGLVHISEVADHYVKDIHDELEMGQTVTVKVLTVGDDGKIGLSIRKAQDKPVEAAPKERTTESPARSNYRREERGGSRPGNRNRSSNNKPSNDFDSLMSSFLKDSEDRLSSLRRNTESKRGGRGGRRG